MPATKIGTRAGKQPSRARRLTVTGATARSVRDKKLICPKQAWCPCNFTFPGHGGGSHGQGRGRDHHLPGRVHPGPDDGPGCGLGAGGERLFDGFGQSLDLEHVWVRQSPYATFLHYQVKRPGAGQG